MVALGIFICAPNDVSGCVGGRVVITTGVPVTRTFNDLQNVHGGRGTAITWFFDDYRISVCFVGVRDSKMLWCSAKLGPFFSLKLRTLVSKYLLEPFQLYVFSQPPYDPGSRHGSIMANYSAPPSLCIDFLPVLTKTGPPSDLERLTPNGPP